MKKAPPAALPALGAGAALSAMIFASRLPPTLDFILPRRAGWALFSAAHEMLARPAARSAFSAAVVLLLLFCAGLYLKRAAAAARGRSWSPGELLARGAWLAAAYLLARGSFSVWFEVSQRVWFPYGSLDPLAPLADFAACSAILFAAGRAGLGLLAAKRPALASLFGAWAAATAAGAALAAFAYGAWASAPGPGEERRLYVALTEEEGRPAQIAYDMPAPSAADLDEYERLAARPGARRLALLRALYEGRVKRLDLDGLRRALELGVRLGDDLARSLQLTRAESLDALGDEKAYRVGPLGAARLALAYAALGEAERAREWARKASAGPRGVPEGLIDLSGGGPLKPGRISGRVLGLRPERVGLYRKDGPGAPYLLDAAALAAASEPGPDGRFSFSGLRAGRYYLAFSFPPDESRRGEVRVLGHRGDAALDARRTSADLPPLTLKVSAR